MIKNKYLSLSFKFVIMVSGLIAILIQCGVFDGNYQFSVLRYYTLLSNVFCVIYYMCAIAYALKKSDTFMPQLKGTLVMCITVTGMVYHFLLSSIFSMQGTKAISNIILHYSVPIMTLLDWLLFDKKGVYKKYSPFIWIIAPYVYLSYVLIVQQFGITFNGSKFPYPFLDVDKLGYEQVVLTVIGLTVFFLVLGFIIYAIDHLMGKKKSSKV